MSEYVMVERALIERAMVNAERTLEAFGSTSCMSELEDMLSAAPTPPAGEAVSGSAWTEQRLRNEAKRRGWYVRESASVSTIDGDWRHPFSVTASSDELLELLNAAPQPAAAAPREPAPAVGEAADIIREFIQCAEAGRPHGKLIAQARDWLASTPPAPPVGDDLAEQFRLGYEAGQRAKAPPVDAELQRDAERYRWLRESATVSWNAWLTWYLPSVADEVRQEFDAAIDAAIQAHRQQGEKGIPCKSCANGGYNGLPGGACSDCMGTGWENGNG